MLLCTADINQHWLGLPNPPLLIQCTGVLQQTHPQILALKQPVVLFRSEKLWNLFFERETEYLAEYRPLLLREDVVLSIYPTASVALLFLLPLPFCTFVSLLYPPLSPFFISSSSAPVPQQHVQATSVLPVVQMEKSLSYMLLLMVPEQVWAWHCCWYCIVHWRFSMGNAQESLIARRCWHLSLHLIIVPWHQVYRQLSEQNWGDRWMA